MATRNFMNLLHAKWAEGKFVCVGLDSDYEKLPAICKFQDPSLSIVAFNKAIIEATADLACAYKPNLAFYIMHGSEGIKALEMTMGWIQKLAPDVPVILDAKFADIGNTNRGYAEFAFGHLGADAVTLQPYLGNRSVKKPNPGKDTFKPFLDYADKGCIFICRTSNPSGDEFQDLMVEPCSEDREKFEIEAERIPLYQLVAYRISRHWDQHRNCCLVAGATYPTELGLIRDIVRDTPLLIPGIGKQGGDLEATVRNGVYAGNEGMIINSSSGIIFASNDKDFAERAREETQKLHNDITRILKEIAK